MDLEIFYQVSEIAIFIAWPASLLFLIYYGFKSPWHLTAVGRALMFLNVSMFALLTLGITSALTEEYYLEPLIQAIVYFFVSAMLWHLFFTLRLVQSGQVSVEQANYSPITTFIRKLRDRRKKKS